MLGGGGRRRAEPGQRAPRTSFALSKAVAENDFAVAEGARGAERGLRELSASSASAAAAGGASRPPPKMARGSGGPGGRTWYGIPYRAGYGEVTHTA